MDQFFPELGGLRTSGSPELQHLPGPLHPVEHLDGVADVSGNSVWFLHRKYASMVQSRHSGSSSKFIQLLFRIELALDKYVSKLIIKY
jgi:hypothetical protein